MSGMRASSDRVFLNVPYNRSYEPLLVALTAALIVLRREPRLTFQLPDGGQGRLRRIFDLLKSCRVSIHDLSAVGSPVRFNMPFELGLSCAIKEQAGQHDFLILERKPHRLHKNLSDVGGIDPKIHRGTANGAICAVLESLERPEGNPSVVEVLALHRGMMNLLPALKARHGNRPLFSARVYGDLIAGGWFLAKDLKLI